MAENKSVFEKLNSIDVNEHTEKKGDLTYLSWAWAWAEVKKRYADVSYEVVKFNGLPYVYDPATGYMVYTRVTIEGITHEMWLPVMDGQNRAMKAEPYTIQTKYKELTVQAATMTDINKTVMRCLTKNLAMFGLGLFIYAGADLPENPVYEFTCSKCGEVFTDAKMANATKEKYGKIICPACIEKKRQELKAKKAAEAKAKAAETNDEPVEI